MSNLYKGEIPQKRMEDSMKKRNVFILGMLVVLLAIGMVFVGCDPDDTGGGTPGGGTPGGGGNTNPFVGTWHAAMLNHPGTILIMTFRADLTVVTNWIGSPGSTLTYTFTGNTATINVVGPNTITISGNSFSWLGDTFVRQ
jgi:hypothetical protein